MWSSPGGAWEPSWEEVSGIDLKCACDVAQAEHGDVAATTLDPGDVRRVASSRESEIHLGQASLLAEGSEPVAEDDELQAHRLVRAALSHDGRGLLRLDSRSIADR